MASGAPGSHIGFGVRSSMPATSRRDHRKRSSTAGLRGRREGVDHVQATGTAADRGACRPSFYLHLTNLRRLSGVCGREMRLALIGYDSVSDILRPRMGKLIRAKRRRFMILDPASRRPAAACPRRDTPGSSMPARTVTAMRSRPAPW